MFAGPGALFGGDEGTSLEEIKDGVNLTIMLVEAARPVPWTKPEDLPFDKEKPLPELGGHVQGRVSRPHGWWRRSAFSDDSSSPKSCVP